MCNLRLQYLCIPMNKHTDHARETVRNRDFTCTKHGDQTPAHFARGLGGEGGGKILCYSENGAGYIFRLHSFIFLKNLLQQFPRCLKNEVRFISGHCRCSTNSTDRHRLLLGLLLGSLSLLRGGGEG